MSEVREKNLSKIAEFFSLIRIDLDPFSKNLLFEISDSPILFERRR